MTQVAEKNKKKELKHPDKSVANVEVPWQKPKKYYFNEPVYQSRKFDDVARIAFLNEFVNSGGLFYKACRASGVHPDTIYDNRDKDERFAKEWEHARKIVKESDWEEVRERAFNENVSIKDTPKGRTTTIRKNDAMLSLVTRKNNPEMFNVKEIRHSGTVKGVVEVPKKTTPDSTDIKIIDVDSEVVES